MNNSPNKNNPCDIVIISPFAPPEKGANVERVEHLQKFFNTQNIVTAIWSPLRSVTEIKEIWRYPSIRALVSRIWKNPPKVIIGTSPPMTHAAIAAIVCFARGTPFILDMRDPWPDAAQKIGLYSKKSLKFWIYKIIEHITYHIAKQIWVVSPYLENWLTKYVPSQKIHIISNGTLPQRFKPNVSLRKKMRTRYAIPTDELTVLFSGDFSAHGLESFLNNTIPTFKKNRCTLIIATSLNKSKNEKYWKDIFEKNSFKSFRLIDLPKLSDKEVSDIFAMSDWGVTLVPDNLPYMIPVKTYDYIASGLFVFARAPLNGALASLITHYNLGSIVRSDELAAKELESVFSKPEEWKKIAVHNRSVSLTLSRDQQAKKALELIHKWIK